MIKKYCHIQTNRNFSIAMVWINGGSNMDEKDKKGINQILCSLLSRGCEGFNNFEFSEYIYSHGAEFNQETFEDGILISLKSLTEHFHKLFPLIDSIINKPILSEYQFKYVKNSLLNSIKKEKENPFNIVYEKWRKIVYLNHPYAFNSIGYEEDIAKISYKDILFEYEKFKSRDKYLISNDLKIKYKEFGMINHENNQEKSNFTCLDLKKKYRCVSTNRKSNQIIIMLGNQTCSQFSNEFLTLKVLESYLSYGMSSKLFRLFREKNGLTYDTGVFNPFRKENSPFLIYLSVSNKNALLAFQLLSKLWQKLLSSQIEQEEIALAKDKLKGSVLISNQSLEEILQRKIQLISNNLDPNYDKNLLKKIEKVNSKQIINITNKYFSKPYLSTYGDKKICHEIMKSWIKDF